MEVRAPARPFTRVYIAQTKRGKKVATARVRNFLPARMSHGASKWTASA